MVCGLPGVTQPVTRKASTPSCCEPFHGIIQKEKENWLGMGRDKLMGQGIDGFPFHAILAGSLKTWGRV